MKRDTLKWILVAAVVVAAAAYLYFSERKPSEKQGRRKARTEQVAIAEGHSKAFKIEPMEGITISAPENALDKDREFKISPVSEKEWEKAVDKVKEEAPWQTPLVCFDLDAGMKPNEVMPGYFQVSLDLNKLGIPKSLHDQITVWRNNDDQTYQYTSWVENGKLYFNSDQNCSIILGIAVGVPFLCSVMWTTSTIGKHKDVLRMYKYFFFKEDDLVMHEVKDKYGNFEIYFRYKDTEWANRFDSYKNHAYLYERKLKELEDRTEEIYSRRVDKQYRGELADMNRLQQIFNSGAAYKRAKEAVDRAFILDSLSKKDEDLQRHIKAMELPPSIKDIEQFLKLAGPYLTENQHMKPQTRTVEVYLLDTKNMHGSNAVMVHRVLKDNPYMLVDYEKLWANNPSKAVYSRRGKGEGLLLSITHEMFHHRHKITKKMDFRTEETLAAYNEFAAGYYYYLKGEITENIFSKDPEGIPYYEKSFELSPRMNHEVFGLDFNTSTSDPGVAYTYADFMDFLQWKTMGQYKFVEGGTLVALYHYYSSHVKNYKKWFFIEDDKQFAEYFHGFCHWKAYKIWHQQSNNSNTSKENKQVDIEMKPHSPVARIKTGKGEYVARSAYINSGLGNRSPAFNLFFVRDKDVTKEDLSFIASYDDFAVNGETGEYINTQPGDYCGDGNQTIYKVVYSKIPNQSLSFLAVALFAPDIPEIRKVKDDQISFIMPKPDRDLRKDKLVTGAVVTYKDKNGVERTHKVASKYFGKKVKWTVEGSSKPGNAFSLSLHWFYQADENTTYDSPESEKATWGVMEDDKPEEVSGKRPETNYWKRVSIRGNMVTSGKVEEKLDGVDFVNPDYRFVEMKQQDMGSFEIEGWAAVNTSKDERIYERTLSLDGELSMTAPPEFWVPGAEYAGVWSMEQDPYVAKIGDPFGFKAEITTTSDKACTASRKAKTDTGRSNHGGSPWIRKYTGTFMARHPEGDAPRAFSLTQTFEVAERPGSDRKALVTYIYDYEWVGEPEEEVEEKPDGSYWKLVHTEVDDSHASFNDQWGTTSKVSGGTGSYSVHSEWWNDHQGNMKYELKGVCDRNIRFDAPKSIYRPGEVLGLKCTMNQVQLKGEKPYGFFFPVASEGEYTMDENVDGVYLDQSYHPREAQEEKQAFSETTQSVPEHTGKWLDGMKICEVVVGTHCWIVTTYYYEWVEAGQKPKQENVSGGHWKLSNTVVSNEPGMMNGGSDIVTVQGGNGNYNAHVERDGDISDREIRFDKPKTVYRPGEQITLNITNDKAKTKNTKDGIVYGVVDFSTAQPGQSTDYPAMDKHPGYNSGKVKGTATGVAPQSGKPGVVDFSITEQIMVKGSYTKTHTTYYYVWEE